LRRQNHRARTQPARAARECDSSRGDELPGKRRAATGFGLCTLRFVFDAVTVPDVQRRGVALQNSAHCEDQTFQGPAEYVRSQGVEVEVLQDPACIQLMRDFIRAKPELWNEDIGK
jgi:hypothetical protein